MDDNQTFPQIPDELYNAGWRVHYSLENNKPYFVNEETKMRADTLPTLRTFPPFTARGSSVQNLCHHQWVYERHVNRGFPKKEAEGLGKPCQQRMDEAMTRFPLGGKRHVVVKRYRGVPDVNIREYYGGETKDRLLAGKRGINLKLE
ncbi:hypothetical protein HOLleu_43452 [Holothuria leucospilota]|uniref:Transcriptional coactivator p15 (PC4) C-terminal domain-containing protein n=1 Tax=Holothuria leucospilota TaxID=206669 RepID=A0A9Q0YEE8_HOLLE|nr:hypothetical protein HOLleu_43452 [Holothuria leucospilota]